jgi:hypothetical protein
MKNIATALVKAQKSFSPALKQSINPHFKSRYVDLAGCVEAVIDALNDNGIFLLQKTFECADGVIVETIFVHESGEMLECGLLHFPATKHDPQGYASALTYARRYSLMAACGIAPEDDDGNATVKREPKELPTKSHVDAGKLSLLIDKMREAETEEQLVASYRIAYQACHNEKKHQDEVVKVKNELKGSINGRNTVPDMSAG